MSTRIARAFLVLAASASASTSPCWAVAQTPASKPAPAQASKPGQPPVSPIPPKPPVPTDPLPEDGGPKAFHYTTDEAIEFFRARVAKTPGDYISMRYLGELFERKGRETGDLAAYATAEEILRKAVAMNPTIPRGRASLAAVLCARHKFAEGLEIARALVKEHPQDIDALSTMGDALLELGRYDEAASTYQTLMKLAPLPEVKARQANLAEMRGQVDQALALMREAVDGARKGRPEKECGWFHARLGDMLLDAGRVDEAEKQYRAVPEGVDALHDATYGLGKVLLARGKLAEARAQFEKALAIGPDLHMLAGLADLQTRLGDAAGAEATARKLAEEAAKQPEHARDLFLFHLDHGQKLPEALALARKEVGIRGDVFTRDALAWALFKNGKIDEAVRAIDEVLGVGTKDAKIHFHAGLIFRAKGDVEKARTHLKQALDTNPHFSVLGPEQARAALAELERKGK